jgi:fatty acid desaturase
VSGTDSKRSDLISTAAIGFHAAFVFLPLYLSVTLASAFTFLIFSSWFGLMMNGLLNLLHECGHGHVFKRPEASARLGRWLLGPLVLADFDGYKKRHWEHHRHLGEDTDPKYVYREKITGKFLFLFLLRCIFLFEAIKRFSIQLPKGDNNGNPSVSRRWILRTLIVQALLFLSLYFVADHFGGRDPGAAWRAAVFSYFAVYLYGMAAFTVFVSSLRAIAEHQISRDSSIHVKDAALRNFSRGFLSGFLLGCYGFKDHATHHVDPAVPYYRLEGKTRDLATNERAYMPVDTYLKTLFSLVISGKPHP